MNGFYLAHYTGYGYVRCYTGREGNGQALFNLKDGEIFIVDERGGLLAGTYADDINGDLDVSVTLDFPKGVLLHGSVSPKRLFYRVIETKLPKDFETGRPVRVDTPAGPLDMSFRKLRDSDLHI